MEDNIEIKPLSAKQGCSKWVNKFADDFLKDKPYSLRELKWITYDYIRLVDWFPDDNVEDIVVDMFKTNYTVLSYFNGDKEKVKKEVEDLFRNNNCLNEFVDDFSIFIKDVVEPLGQNKHEIFITQTKNKLDHYDKIDKVYNTGLLDWNFVKNQFNTNMDFWKVKEAISWMVGFVENCDYKLTDLLILNSQNKVDKQKTFENLIEKINKASLTQQNPFSISKGKYYFNDAKGGEVDVMLWNESKRSIVSMSATRDRGFKIEGNQFPRHYIKSLVLHHAITELHMRKKIPLTSENVQTIVRNESFKNLYSFDKISNVDCHEDVKSEISNLNVFSRDLTVVRNNIKKILGVDFHKNGLNITDKELSSILAYGDGKVKFVFFGELLEKTHMPAVQAGLNCLAYRDNFKRLGKFRMTNNASNIFMRSIVKRFNGISPSEQNIDLYGQKFIIELIKDSQNVNRNISSIQYFSEGNVFSEERACLFKACSVLFRNVITELDLIDRQLRNCLIDLNGRSQSDMTNIAIERGVKFFFDQGIDKNNLSEITKFFSSPDKMSSFILNFDTIKTSISEVPLELEELEFCKERVVASFNNVKDRVEISELLEFKNSLLKVEKNNITIESDNSELKIENNSVKKQKKFFIKRK